MSTRGRELDGVPDDGQPAPAVHDDIESPSGKLVYLYLVASGGATVAEMKRALDLPTLTIYPVLRTLRERDLIERSGDQFELPS